MTRNYYSELAEFLGGFEPEQIESYRESVAEALKKYLQTVTAPGSIRRPDWRDGDYYFASIVEPRTAIEPQTIAIGAFLDYAAKPQSNAAAAQSAAITHIALNNNLLHDNPRLLDDFFRVLHRAASARQKTQLHLTTTLHTSLPHFLTRGGYRIASHEFHGDDNILRVKFCTDLVPDYTGDVLKWAPLCRWYLALSFSQHLDVPLPEAKAAEQTVHTIPINIKAVSRPGGATAGLGQMQGLLPSVPITAIVVPGSDLLNTRTLADELEPHLAADRYNIALLDRKRPRNPDSTQLTRQCRIVYRNDLDDLLRGVKSLYFAKPAKGQETERRDRLLDMKLAFDRNRRKGLIVEIDRASYTDLLKKLNSKDRPDRFLFLNDGGFGEAVDPGVRIYFFVWDAFGESRDAEIPGVIAACGRVAEVKAWTSEQLQKNWCDLSRFTIWAGEFADQYFSFPVVGFFLDELECVVPGNIEDDPAGPLQGVSYDSVLFHVFPTFAGRDPTPTEKAQLRELMPPWDVKNTYLDETLGSTLYDKLRLSARLEKLIAPPPVYSANRVGRPAPSDPTQGAAYWIANPPKPSGDQSPDVFFSFAGADEVGGQWKTYVVRSFEGSLTAAGFQTPYVFDEESKLGKEWPAVLAERMSRCRTAVILWSPAYIASATCYNLELPYLLWRRRHENLDIFLLRLNNTAKTRFNWDDIDVGPGGFDVSIMNDDRMAVNNAAGCLPHLKEATLQSLRDRQEISLLNERLQGTLKRIIDCLQAKK